MSFYNYILLKLSMLKKHLTLIIISSILVIAIIFGGVFLSTQNTKNDSQNLVKSQTESQADSETLEEINLNSKTQPLVADQDHHVAVIEECDLAVRYQKQINLMGEKYKREINYFDGNFSLINLNSNVMDEPSGMDITCNQEVMSEGMYDLISNQKDKTEICKILNLTNSSCDKIENPQEYLMTKNYTPNRNILFKFTANNNEYKILLGYLNSETKGGLENIQIQFDSLAPSTPSVILEVEKAEKTEQKLLKQLLVKTQQTKPTQINIIQI